LVSAFVATHSVPTLNVAGPRASKVPSAYAYTFDFVSYLLTAGSAGAREPSRRR
jgi:hypothetical protein